MAPLPSLPRAAQEERRALLKHRRKFFPGRKKLKGVSSSRSRMRVLRRRLARRGVGLHGRRFLMRSDQRRSRCLAASAQLPFVGSDFFDAREAVMTRWGCDGQSLRRVGGRRRRSMMEQSVTRRTLPCVGQCDAPRAKRRVLSCAGACDDGRAGDAPGACTGYVIRNCFSTPCGRRFSRSGEALHSHEQMDAKAAEERRFPCTPVKSCSASHPAEQKGGLSAHACKDRAAARLPDPALPLQSP